MLARLLLTILILPRMLPAPDSADLVPISDLIIIGRLSVTSNERRLFQGWLLEGTIEAREVLFGPVQPGERVRYKFVCTCCRGEIGRELRAMTERDERIWFLRRNDKVDWTSAGSCSDPGLRPLSSLDHIKHRLALRLSQRAPK